MLDEPSLGVAPKLVDEIYEKILALKRIGLTVLLVEQNTGYALELADRGYVLENGQIAMEGTAAESVDQRAYQEILPGSLKSSGRWRPAKLARCLRAANRFSQTLNHEKRQPIIGVT